MSERACHAGDRFESLSLHQSLGELGTERVLQGADDRWAAFKGGEGYLKGGDGG